MKQLTRKIVLLALLFVLIATPEFLIAGPPIVGRLEPLTADRARPMAAVPAPANPATELVPLFYYNGAEKVYLFDTGHGAAKVKADTDLSQFAARPETLVISPDTPYAEFAGQLLSRRIVIVRTRGMNSLGLGPTGEASGIVHLLPVVQESLRPVAPAPPTDPGDPPIAVMTPEISVRFVPDFFARTNGAAERRARAEEYLSGFGLKISNPVDKPPATPNAYTAVLADGAVTFDRIITAANQLYEKGHAAGKIVFAKPNFIRQLRRKQTSATVSEPRFENQWHLHNTGQGRGLPDADIDAPEAWRVTEGRPEIRIAILDDSVQRTHPDLSANYQTGRRYVGDSSYENDPSPRSTFERHGTACAGLAVGAANEIGIRGVAPRCGLIGVSIFETSVDDQLADAFYFAADPDSDPTTDDGAAVISCSWDLRDDRVIPIELASTLDELSRAGRKGKGVVILYAAGNSGRSMSATSNLANRESVIAVGATNFMDVRAIYSSTGPELDVMAPSCDLNFTDRSNYLDPSKPLPDVFPLWIDTTDNTDDQPRLPNDDRSGFAVGDYTGTASPPFGTGFGGTSASAPIAAGVCGLILSVNPNLTACQVRAILEHTCDRVRGPSNLDFLELEAYDIPTGRNNYYGYGRVNAARAVRAALETQTAIDAVWPDHVQELSLASESTSSSRLTWKNPSSNAATILLVQDTTAIRWKPRDGEQYQTGQAVGSGTARVYYAGPGEELDVPKDPVKSTYCAVFVASNERKYSWGQVVEIKPSAPAPPAPSPAANRADPQPRGVQKTSVPTSIKSKPK